MTTELSDNSESQRMTPPPKLLTLCDSAIDRGNVFPKNDTNIAPTDKTINDNDFHDNDKENQSPNEIETNNLDCLNDNEDLESYHRIGNASQETMFTPNFVHNILFEDLPSGNVFLFTRWRFTPKPNKKFIGKNFHKQIRDEMFVERAKRELCSKHVNYNGDNKMCYSKTFSEFNGQTDAKLRIRMAKAKVQPE
ncbi:uncharacterized protein LOC105206407 isoform X1 [Solenopsis invicta]|uniref:uncharacterized protein LOC105206407 isoform X1 n=1 Tax=Solenopsis invicta TaxID=13686 RepID=UPI00193DDDE5|nr:uncharacterized protein LOC105206407 isoform X1 [Solenopsis invicta]XP_039313231.1 uncharacterized protein LOC105206407 isoform X1 [Solenopsis invicta]